jgi:hypothetical protein
MNQRRSQLPCPHDVHGAWCGLPATIARTWFVLGTPHLALSCEAGHDLEGPMDMLIAPEDLIPGMDMRCPGTGPDAPCRRFATVLQVIQVLVSSVGLVELRLIHCLDGHLSFGTVSDLSFACVAAAAA